jgi:hypothetical protein
MTGILLLIATPYSAVRKSRSSGDEIGAHLKTELGIAMPRQYMVTVGWRK